MAGLNPNFIHKVLHGGPFTDTSKYRYSVQTESVTYSDGIYQRTVIKRIPIDMLGTTAAYDNNNYETVWRGSYRKGE